MPSFKYSNIRKTEHNFPLWEVTIYQNWNEENFTVNRGEEVVIRLFKNKIAASHFSNGIDNLLREIQDVEY